MICFIYLLITIPFSCFGAFSTRDVSIGSFHNPRSVKPHDHNVTSGTVTLRNDKVMEIRDFTYDGTGPFAYWSIGLRNQQGQISPHEYGDYRSNRIVQDGRRSASNSVGGRCRKPERYKGSRVVLTLPANYTWKDVSWLGVYCYGYKHLFNYISIPQSAKITNLERNKNNAGYDCNKEFGVCGKTTGSRRRQRGQQGICYSKCVDKKNCAADLV